MSESWDIAADRPGDRVRGRGHRYAARWWGPAFRPGRRHRFVLVAYTGRPELAAEPVRLMGAARSAGRRADLSGSRGSARWP
jgi:hypothetical protein